MLYHRDGPADDDCWLLNTSATCCIIGMDQLMMIVGCLIPLQHAGASQGPTSCASCHTERVHIHDSNTHTHVPLIYINTLTPLYTCSYRHTHTHTYSHTRMHTHTHRHTCPYICMHACTRIRVGTRTFTHTDTLTSLSLSLPLTHTHTHTHTYINTFGEFTSSSQMKVVPLFLCAGDTEKKNSEGIMPKDWAGTDVSVKRDVK